MNIFKYCRQHAAKNAGKTRRQQRFVRLENFRVVFKQGLPTFLKLRATSWVPINTKGYQYNARFWNTNFA